MIKTGRIAVITGAAQGIGRRAAELLAEQGYSLVLNDLRSPIDTLRAVRDLGAEALEVLGDISDESVVAKIAAAPREKWRRADVLVNNAGISFIAPAETLSAAEYRRVLEINLVAPFLLAKAFGSRKGATRLISSTRRYSAAERVSAGAMKLIPALFTSTSARRHFSLGAAAILATTLSSEMSPSTSSASAPRSRTALRVSIGERRSLSTRLYPCSARSSAARLPMPWAAPVITAMRPVLIIPLCLPQLRGLHLP